MSEKDTNLLKDQSQDIVDITELINPFPGLRPFGIEEGHLFFGREGQSDEVLLKLSGNKFVSILGASGSGKSSFMYCGLVPSLLGGFMTEAGSDWRVVVSRPGGGPIDNLAESLLIKDKSYSNLSEEDKLIKKTIISTVLRSSSLGLVEVIKQLKTDNDQNILIVIDQFEELFRFRKLESTSSDADESSAFVNLLLEAIHQFDEPIYVALTMRSDFIGECAKFPDLTQMINDSHYLIPQMTRDQKRSAVEGPVAVGGGKIAPRLTQQLLNDVGDNPDQLPILQHAMMRTWSYWVENRQHGEAMDLRHYNAIGTLKEALSQHANEAYDSLNKREKEIAEVMFKALTERGSENQGIRRPSKLGTIASIAGVTEDEVIHVVEKFREPGRSLLMPPYGVKLESETVIDISHESLMRIWDRLKRWLDEESKASEMYLKLSEASERFQQGKASLWKMPDLQLALNWREENNPTLVWGQRYNPAFERTMVFLETSEKAYVTEQRNLEILQKRKVRNMRITAVILGLATLVCLFLFVLGQLRATEAVKQSNLAKANEQRALEQEQQAQKNLILAQKAEDNAKAQADTARQQTILAQQQTERANQQTERANAQTRVATAAKEDALEQEKIAAQERDNAQIAEQQAVVARDRAEELRMLSISQSMAIKATKIVGDKDLKGVVARQAYDYYHEFKDSLKSYNGDVYAGVYSGLRGLMDKRFIDTDVQFKGDSILNWYKGHTPIINRFGQERQVGAKSMVFNNDGSRLYSVGSDGRLLSWDMTSENRSFRELIKLDMIFRVVAISPNERFIAVGTDLSHIQLYDRNNSNAAPKPIKGHVGGKIFDLLFTDDDHIISVGADNRIILHGISDGTATEIKRLSSKVNSIDINSEGTTMAVGTVSDGVTLIDLADEEYADRTIYNREGSQVTSVVFNNTGDKLAIGYESADMVIWDLVNKTKYGVTLGGFIAGVSDIEFSPNDDLIIASSTDGTARMWDLNNIFDLPTIFDDHSDWINDLVFHPDGNSFMTAEETGIIRLFYTKADDYANQICSKVVENMSELEWQQYVGDIDYVYTCEGLPMGADDE